MNKLSGRDPYLFASRLTRASTILFGLSAAIWAASVCPDIFNQNRLASISQSIVAGNVIDAAFLATEAKAGANEIAASRFPHPKALSTLAFIRVHLLERSLRGSSSHEIDRDFADAIAAIRTSLDVSPTDAFLWFALFWSTGVSTGFKPEHLRLLRFSYEFGPREGWVAVRRNRLGLQLYPFLPPELAEAVVQEFVGLVESGFFAESVDLMTGPGWPIHDVLLSRLQTVPLAGREELAAALRSRGYDVTPPGVTERRQRPWN
jgi:hypothetical protein